MSKLIIDGNNISIPDLVEGKLPIDSYSVLQRNVLSFIIQWYEDNSSFKVGTSGSTGPQKTLVITKKAMEESARMTAEAIKLKSGMVSLLAMNPEFIAGKMMIARALTLNMDLVVVPPSSNPIKDLDPGTKIDFTALVPLQLETLLDSGYGDQLNSMHAILVGGAPVSRSLAEKVEALNVPVFHTDGMTETISHIALRRLNGAEKRESYQVLGNLQIDMDKRGCLIISGGFLSGSLTTNDQVEIISSNEFHWLGRLDNVINSGGIKLNPETIEPRIAQLLHLQNEHISQLFLAGIPDNKFGEKMILFIEGKLSNNKENILNWFRSNLDAYQCPKDVIELKEFNRTPSGKLKRGPMIESYLASKKGQ